MRYQVAYDIGRSGCAAWHLAVIGLFFVGLGACLVVESRQARRTMRVFAWAWVIFALAWFGLAFGGTYLRWHLFTTALEEGRTKTAEGKVEDFVPMPRQGHARESFGVRGIRFSFSDYAYDGGFNTTSAHGGPIREGLSVRIRYVATDSGNKIVRLETDRKVPLPPREPDYVPAALVAVLVGALFVVLYAQRGGGTLFRRYEEGGTRYLESMVSGRSHRAWYTKIGGVNNALTVALTRGALAIRPIFPFSLLVSRALPDLDQELPLDRILSVEKKRFFLRDELLIEYLDAGGGRQTLGLIVSRPDELSGLLKDRG